MSARQYDWLRQAEADLRHAHHARGHADHEWACFASQQAAEKSLKAVLVSRGEDAWGHTVTALLGLLVSEAEAGEELIWFGSRVNGTPAPGSDVDACVVISRSDRRFRDRIGDYLPFGFPVGIDLFPYTVAELDRLRDEHPAWYRAITSGIEIR